MSSVIELEQCPAAIPTEEQARKELAPLAEAIKQYGKGALSLEEYILFIDMWWSAHKGQWQEQDLRSLFLLCI